jgi:hypothetical protein
VDRAIRKSTHRQPKSNDENSFCQHSMSPEAGEPIQLGTF